MAKSDRSDDLLGWPDAIDCPAHENAAHENAAHENAAHENAAHENAAHENAADEDAATFEIEALEPRVLLSASCIGVQLDELDCDVAPAPSVDAVDSTLTVNGEEDLLDGIDCPNSEPISELESPRTIDGSGNNPLYDTWGQAGTNLLRLVSSDYADEYEAPAGEDRPGARTISNAIFAQTEGVESQRGLSDMVWVWGQFIDHDLSLTESGEVEESLNIEVPQGDRFFDPQGTGEVSIGLDRSDYDESGTESAPRQQTNDITAFIDGSMIYGSDPERADALRTFEGGRLATSDGDLLPYNASGLPNAGGESPNLFLAGDVRANENPALTAMHTIWVREHNHWADQISSEHPDWSDEQVFQQARAIVIAEIQAITYNEFLPALLGAGSMGEYAGYDIGVNPGIANEFSTAAFRLGHSMLPTELALGPDTDPDGNGDSLRLQEAFFAVNQVAPTGIEALLTGAAGQTAQEIDTLIVDDVRNFLFGPPGAGGFDLVSLNIQRGRDHGLPDYNQTRIELGLEPVKSFSDITSDANLAASLEAVYGDVDSIDLWVGGLAEDHVEGGSVGELFHTIIVDQFERLRSGDRYWYQSIFDSQTVADMDRLTLSTVIERNTDANLPANVFFT